MFCARLWRRTTDQHEAKSLPVETWKEISGEQQQVGAWSWHHYIGASAVSGIFCACLFTPVWRLITVIKKLTATLAWNTIWSQDFWPKTTSYLSNFLRPSEIWYLSTYTITTWHGATTASHPRQSWGRYQLTKMSMPQVIINQSSASALGAGQRVTANNPQPTGLRTLSVPVLCF